MGLRRTLGLAALGALFIPPLVAAVARRRLVDAGDEQSSELDRYAIFDGVQLASRTPGFRGGETIAWYGSVDLDLREARLDPGGAHVRAMSIFGGTRIIVPEDWAVELHGKAFAGGVMNDTDRSLGDGPGPRLVVEATALFGAVEVTTRGDLEAVIEQVVEGSDLARAEAEAVVEAEVEAATEAGASSEAAGD
jgi:hypothetical protein